MSRSFSEIRNAVGAFPFAKTHCKGERPTRSAVCTSSPLRSLRPCWTAFLNSLLAVRGRPQPPAAYVSLSSESFLNTPLGELEEVNHSPLHVITTQGAYRPIRAMLGQKPRKSAVERGRSKATCWETVGDGERPLSETYVFSGDRGCSRLPTDLTVKKREEVPRTVTREARELAGCSGLSGLSRLSWFVLFV